MTASNKKQQDTISKIINLLFGLPWLEIMAELWQITQTLWRGLAHEGMYEVLEYEAKLELQNKQGTKATYQKREKVRYVQDNILAYQDQAWGDGEILVNYRCSPGREVDRYRPGQKTLILISLQEMKKRDDIDEFNIEWGIRNGFTRSIEQWETEISHKTKYFSIEVYFPSQRPPIQASLIEHLHHRKHILGPESIRQMPDGGWRVQWETQRPRLHERYILRWEW